MKKQFAVYEATMAEAFKTFVLLMQEKEIAAVSNEYKALDIACEQMRCETNSI